MSRIFQVQIVVVDESETETEESIRDALEGRGFTVAEVERDEEQEQEMKS